MPADREWLLAHLDAQLRHLAQLAVNAREKPSDDGTLFAIRDEICMVRETMNSLGIPHALASNADWAHATARAPA